VVSIIVHAGDKCRAFEKLEMLLPWVIFNAHQLTHHPTIDNLFFGIQR